MRGVDASFSSTILLLLLSSAVSITVVLVFGHFLYKADMFLSSESQFGTPTEPAMVSALRSYEYEAAVLSPQLPRSWLKTVQNKAERSELEQGLARARAQIRKKAASMRIRNRSAIMDDDTADISFSPVYRNPAAFLQSYKEMERIFKVYVYEEGEVPMVHDGPCKDIYSSEGRFIHEMEHGGGGGFRTTDPRAAHVFFMPFSVTWMVKFLYSAPTYDISPLQHFVHQYVKLIATNHPFWNRTQGADHFMLACHDWGPHASRGNGFLYNTSIRVLCNANTSEGFNPKKDVSLPEVHLYGGEVNPMLIPPTPHSDSHRPYLAFFAGGDHGYIRPRLLKHWKDTDPSIKVSDYLTQGEGDYYDFMLQSKFCLCPSGYEVASPRIVEAIYAECVPVILSDNYVLPFSDVLRWETFSVQVNVSDISQLKQLLEAISQHEYTRLKHGLRDVRRHFELNRPIKRFDMFTMILHSVWLRRLDRF